MRVRQNLYTKNSLNVYEIRLFSVNFSPIVIYTKYESNIVRGEFITLKKNRRHTFTFISNRSLSRPLVYHQIIFHHCLHPTLLL